MNWNKRNLPPLLKFEWLTEYAGNYTIGNVPFNRFLLDTARVNRPINQMLAAGINALQINGGALNDTYDGSLPVAARWVCTGQDSVTNATGNKPMNQWGDQDADNAADAAFAQRDMMWSISQSLEGPNNGDIYEINPSKWVRMYKRKTAHQLGLGRRELGPYPGCVRTPDSSQQYIADALATYDTCLTFMKTVGGAGGAVTAWTPYFLEECWKWGMDALVNIYYSNANQGNDNRWIYDIMAKMLLVKGAMIATGSGRIILTFCEGCDNELTNYTARYDRHLEPSGTVTTFNWAPRPFGSMRWAYFLGNMILNGNTGFAPDTVFGKNPNVVLPADYGFGTPLNDGGHPELYSRAAPGRIPVSDNAVLGFIGQPVGFEDLRPVALADWAYMANLVGNDKWYLAAFSVNGGTQFVPTPVGNYSCLKTMHDQQLPVLCYGKSDTQGDNTRWLAGYVTGKPGTEVMLSIDCGGVTFTGKATAHVPFFFTNN